MMNFRILKKETPLYSRNIIFSGGMGGARTDGGHPVTGPILKKISLHRKKGDYLYSRVLDKKRSFC
jgi:hypothetical protein